MGDREGGINKRCMISTARMIGIEVVPEREMVKIRR